MRTWPVALIFLGSCLLLRSYAQDYSKIKESMSGPATEEIQSTVLKVFSAHDERAAYRAYLVTWKGQEVVAEDPFGVSQYKEGDAVRVLVQTIEIPVGTNILRSLTFGVIHQDYLQ